MSKKIIHFLFIFILFFLNFNFSYKDQNKDSLFIFESPKVDYEDYLNDNHSFVNFNGCIYSINKNYLVVLSRYYIPIKKIKIKLNDPLIDSDYEFLYLFDTKSGKIYKFDGKKIYFLKRLYINQVKDFKVYKEKFYFLKDEKLLIYDLKNSVSEFKFKKNYSKFRIKKDKIYLINKNEIAIFNLKEGAIVEKNISNHFIKSFDIDIDGKIYVLSKKKILVFNEDLKLLRKIDIEKEGDEIFFDLSRSIVLYFKNEGIKVLPPQFELKIIENLEYPSDFTLDKKGNLYLLNTKNSEILIFDKDFNLKNKFGKGILKYPTGIFYYKEKLYVADSWNNKIRVFDTDGKLLFSFGSFGKKNFEFSYPLKVKVYNDLTYVLDVYNHKLKVFDLNWEYKYSFGESPFKYLINLFKPNDVLFEPNEFIVSDGNVFIVDKARYELILFGKKENKRIKLNDLITNIINLNGNLYFLGNRWKYVYLYKNSKFLPVFSFSYNYYEKLKNLKPYSILICNGEILLLDKLNGKLLIISGDLYD